MKTLSLVTPEICLDAAGNLGKMVDSTIQSLEEIVAVLSPVLGKQEVDRLAGRYGLRNVAARDCRFVHFSWAHKGR